MKNRNARAALWRLAACLTALAGFEAPARGQPIVTDLDSIEWMAADSARIVRGAVVGLETINAEEFLWHTVTFRVDETLKGEHRPEIRFLVQSNARDEKEIRRWKDEGRPLLAFLQESRCVVATWRYREWSRFPFAPRTGYRERSFLELTPGAEKSAYDLSLKALNRPEAILRATREAVATPTAAGKLCETWLDLPGSGGLTRLHVPVDSRLEARAREWLRSPDKEFRRQGAAALVYFHSDANAAALKGLLDDPGVWIVHSLDAGRAERVERAYLVREEAYSVLKAWGYDTARPPRRGPLP